MKIIIEAEPKEIAALVEELEGRQTVVSKIKFNGDSITHVVEGLARSSEVTQEADKIGIRVERFSESDISEIDKRLAERMGKRNIAAQVEEVLERRYDAEWLKQQAEYLFGTRAKAHAQELREAERKKQEAEQLKKES